MCDKGTPKERGDDDMSKVLDKLSDLRKEMKEISKDMPILRSGENDAIELDPKNPRHREWYKGR